MNGALGSAGVVLGLAAGRGGRAPSADRRARRRRALFRVGGTYAWLVLAGAVIAVVFMERALITRDFTVRYVAEHGSTRTPPLFNVATLWAALEGSILLWALVLSGYVVAVARKFRARMEDALREVHAAKQRLADKAKEVFGDR